MLLLAAASTMPVGSPLKGLALVVTGVALGLVGMDSGTGQLRCTFGSMQLMDGITLVALGMGLFGVAEIQLNLGKTGTPLDPRSITLRSLLPSRRAWRQSLWPTARGGALGSAVGILPGTGPATSAFMAYALEKRIARDPDRFGKGAVEGIASPEAANTASVQAAFIPTLSLGVPGDAIIAILLGAMMMHGIVPGPRFITDHPETFWGLVASFWIGNILPLLLGFILGPLMEEHLKRALQISRGDFAVFVERPISAVFMALTVLVLAMSLRTAVLRVRAQRHAGKQGGD